MGVAEGRDRQQLSADGPAKHYEGNRPEHDRTIRRTIRHAKRPAANDRAGAAMMGAAPDRTGALWAALGDALDSGDVDEARAVYGLLARRAELVAG